MDVLSLYLALLLVLNGLLKKNHSQTLIVLLLSMQCCKFEGLENAGLQKVFPFFFPDIWHDKYMYFGEYLKTNVTQISLRN